MKKTGLGDAMEAFDPTALERLQPDFSDGGAKKERGDIVVRLPRDVRKVLKQLALDRNTTMQ